MNPLLRKSIADATHRRSRTILATLGIFAGVLGATAVLEATALITGRLTYTTDPNAAPNIVYIDPASSHLPTPPLRGLSGIQHLETRRAYIAHWHLSHRRGEQPVVEIIGFLSGAQTRFSQFQLVSGRLPGRGEILMDVRDLAIHSVSPGGTIRVDAPGGRQVRLRVSGLVRTRGLADWFSLPDATAYIRSSDLERLARAIRSPGSTGTLGHLTSEILAIDWDNPLEGYDEVGRVLRAAHITPLLSYRNYATFYADAQLQASGLLLVIQAMTAVALGLVSVMIFNSVSALLREQVGVIGTMRALGGVRGKIVLSYLVTVQLYGCIGTAGGVLVGLPLGYQLAERLASTVQVDVGSFGIEPSVIVIGAAVGMLVPPLAALWPIMVATRISVRDALAAYGVHSIGAEPVSVIKARVTLTPLPIRLSMRSLFRRPVRTALTLAALTLATTLFITVEIANSSMGANFDHLSNLFHSDYQVKMANLGDTVRTTSIIRDLKKLSNVADVEPITPLLVSVDNAQLGVIGLPGDTRLYQPVLFSGRWLHTSDPDNVVVNNYAAERLHLHVGERVSLHLYLQHEQQVTWTIVGIVHEVDNVSESRNSHPRLGDFFTTLTNLNRTLRHLPPDASQDLYVRARNESPAAIRRLQRQIEHVMIAVGQPDADVLTTQQQIVEDPLATIYSLFYAVAIIAGIIGGLSLTQTLVTSVIERRTEIGILRALGATSWRVGFIFGIEGLALSGIAWILGIAIGLPTGDLVVDELATYLGPMDVVYSSLLLPATLLFVFLAAVLATVLPAWDASRVHVQSALRYE